MSRGARRTSGSLAAVQWRLATVGVLTACALSLASGAALAQSRPTSKTFGYSAYEKETIARTLAETGETIDRAPEGKIIEGVETRRLEVLEDRDPIPEQVLGIKTRKLANSLHAVSKDYVIRREMLIGVGDAYEQIWVDETARNMRARMPLQASIIIIVPITGTAPDRVKLLVITKDIWSLRLSYDMSVTPGGLENLLIVPQETNLFGWQHTVSTSFQLQPESYTLGAGYKIPRFGSSWIGASAGASISVNRRTGEAEGSSLSLSVGQGLYSTRTKWGWSASASESTGVARRYVNAQVGLFNSSVTPNVADNIPTQYKSAVRGASVGVTRSFGWGIKNNFSLSMNAAKAEYTSFGNEAFDPRAVADFQQRFVPRGEDRVYPALSWATFSNHYLRTIDINTLALQEDFRLGHDVSASVYPVAKALGSTRDLVGFSAKVGYSLRLGDGLAGASVSTFAEDSHGDITDASVAGSFGAISPRTGFGRVVMNAYFINRYQNYLRARTTTGGDDRLRGYPSNYFFGKDAIFYNLEFRSTSVEILKCALGGVAFYDVGDAAQGFDMLRAKQSVGVGLRALFPQVNRLVFRADLAFPMQRGPFPEQGITTRVDPVGFFFSFDQAFSP
ncbi:MAG: outer membrane protein assembly factor YaeT precursor [Labilithrix sp.]|nr:outer membrane protein assembly factor YaeT precursor [Labilithrix sp.]